MKTYLLKATEADMGRWQETAKAREMTFAEFVRRALNRYVESGPERMQSALPTLEREAKPFSKAEQARGSKK